MHVLYGEIPDHRHRFIHNVGVGFLMGASGGTVYHLIRGLRGGGGLAGGARAIQANVPRLAGKFGGYIAMLCALETAISRARRREDGWSSIAAGAVFLAAVSARARQGAPVVSSRAVLGTGLAAVPMGLSWTLSEWHSRFMLYRDHREDEYKPSGYHRVSYDRIPDHLHHLIHYVGGGFILGASCGTVYHLIRGFCGGGGLAGGARAVRANAPSVAGWFGAYCALETAISRARRREDGWSSIAAGAASLAVLNARQGASVVAGSVVLGAATVAVPMGLGWTFRDWHSRLMLYSDHLSVVLDASERVAVAPRSTTPEQVKKR